MTSPGIAWEMSRSARSQSKRAAARPRTVSTRAEASAWKSAYGFSAAAFAVAAVVRCLVVSRSASRCLMSLVVMT